MWFYVLWARRCRIHRFNLSHSFIPIGTAYAPIVNWYTKELVRFEICANNTLLRQKNSAVNLTLLSLWSIIVPKPWYCNNICNHCRYSFQYICYTAIGVKGLYYFEYQSFCPVVWIGTPTPPSASECASPSWVLRVGHTHLRGWGMWGPNSDDFLERNSSIPLRCYVFF
jgi:hypothetical protein